MTSLIYNLLMLAIDGALLAWLHRRRTRGDWVAGAGIFALIAVLLAAALGEDGLGMVRLLAYGVFAHGFILLVGKAALLWRPRRMGAAAFGSMAVLLELVAADAFLIEPEWLEVTRYEIQSEKLTRPVRVAVIADLQTDRVGDYERRVLARVMSEAPDLILMTGDYLQEEDEGRLALLRAEMREAMIEAGLSAPMGVYAVEGDLEGEGWETMFEGLGVTILGPRESVELGEITLTGLGRHESFDSALAIGRDRNYAIVFGHGPDYALGNVEAELLIAGHTHGGQVRLPGVGPLVTLSKVSRRWAAGMTELDGGRRLIVSRGIGMERAHAPRMRFLCRPELTVIDLVPAAD